MLNFVCHFQNVPLEHMASTVKTAVIHVLAKHVNHVMEIVHMVVQRVLKEFVVMYQVC